MRRGIAAVLVVLLAACSTPPPPPPTASPPAAAGTIAWRDFTKDAFAQAKDSKRLVLLDLGTGWCHWCHVMDETTYRDATVVSLVGAHFVATRADADARLDLASRYADYGWPATIIFDATGRELVKFRGYIAPPRMAALLRGVVEDPTPGPSAFVESSVAPASSAALSVEQRTTLEAQFAKGVDEKLGGWGDVHKFIDLDSFELELRRALKGDEGAEAHVKKTLAAERAHLVDPVWGGAYQYSHGGVWENPHFEKIMARQAADLIAFSLGYAAWHDPADLDAARAIERYLVAFLSSPAGTFYASQDADLVKGEHGGEYFALDDAARRAKGIPAVDKHVYARENGWAIEGLCALYAVSGDEKTLERARTAAKAILASHGIEGGGFRHDAADTTNVYLEDTLAMGRALLALFRVTGERSWIDAAKNSAHFVAENFPAEAGFAPARASGELAAPLPELDANVSVARFMSALHRVTTDGFFREQAERAMRFVAAPAATARRGHWVAGVLLADEELSTEPLHVTVRGDSTWSDGDEWLALVRAALALPDPTVVIERAPGGHRAEAELCGAGVCKPPVHSPDALDKIARGLLRAK